MSPITSQEERGGETRPVSSLSMSLAVSPRKKKRDKARAQSSRVAGHNNVATKGGDSRKKKNPSQQHNIAEEDDHVNRTIEKDNGVRRRKVNHHRSPKREIYLSVSSSKKKHDKPLIEKDNKSKKKHDKPIAEKDNATHGNTHDNTHSRGSSKDRRQQQKQQKLQVVKQQRSSSASHRPSPKQDTSRPSRAELPSSSSPKLHLSVSSTSAKKKRDTKAIIEKEDMVVRRGKDNQHKDHHKDHQHQNQQQQQVTKRSSASQASSSMYLSVSSSKKNKHRSSKSKNHKKKEASSLKPIEELQKRVDEDTTFNSHEDREQPIATTKISSHDDNADSPTDLPTEDTSPALPSSKKNSVSSSFKASSSSLVAIAIKKKTTKTKKKKKKEEDIEFPDLCIPSVELPGAPAGIASTHSSLLRDATHKPSTNTDCISDSTKDSLTHDDSAVTGMPLLTPSTSPPASEVKPIGKKNSKKKPLRNAGGRLSTTKRRVFASRSKRGKPQKSTSKQESIQQHESLPAIREETTTAAREDDDAATPLSFPSMEGILEEVGVEVLESDGSGSYGLYETDRTGGTLLSRITEGTEVTDDDDAETSLSFPSMGGIREEVGVEALESDGSASHGSYETDGTEDTSLSRVTEGTEVTNFSQCIDKFVEKDPATVEYSSIYLEDGGFGDDDAGLSTPSKAPPTVMLARSSSRSAASRNSSSTKYTHNSQITEVYMEGESVECFSVQCFSVNSDDDDDDDDDGSSYLDDESTMVPPKYIMSKEASSVASSMEVSAATSVVMRIRKNTKKKTKKGVQKGSYHRGKFFPTANSTTASIEYDDAAEKISPPAAGGRYSTTRTTSSSRRSLSSRFSRSILGSVMSNSSGGDGDSGADVDADSIEDSIADSLPLQTTMSMASSVASTIGVHSVTSFARNRLEMDSAQEEEEKEKEVEENHLHRGTTDSPTMKSNASIDSENTEESSVVSAGTSLSQIPNSAIPAKESQAIGGPKYYIATQTKRGQARVVHGAMPSIHEEESSQGGVSGVSGDDASSSVAEEMGYEIMEYELVREAAEKEEEEMPSTRSRFSRKMLGSSAVGDDTEADSYCAIDWDDDGTRSMMLRTDTSMSGSVGTSMLGSVAEYGFQADSYCTDDDETRSMTSRTEASMTTSVATSMLGSVDEYGIQADSYYTDSDESSVAPVSLGSVAGDTTEADGYCMGDDGTRPLLSRAEAPMVSSVATGVLVSVSGDNTEADDCYTIHSDTICRDNDGAGSTPLRTATSMASSVANSIETSIASVGKGNKKTDEQQTKKKNRGGAASPTYSTTSIISEDAYSCIMVASIGGSVDSIGTRDTSATPAKGSQLAGGMPAIHGDETPMNCEC